MDNILKGKIEDLVANYINNLSKCNSLCIYFNPYDHNDYGYAKDETEIQEGFKWEYLMNLIKEKHYEDVEDVRNPIEDMYELDEEAIEVFANS